MSNRVVDLTCLCWALGQSVMLLVMLWGQFLGLYNVFCFCTTIPTEFGSGVFCCCFGCSELLENCTELYRHCTGIVRTAMQEHGCDGKAVKLLLEPIFVLCQWFSALSVNVSRFCFGLFLLLLFCDGAGKTLSTIDKI